MTIEKKIEIAKKCDEAVDELLAGGAEFHQILSTESFDKVFSDTHKFTKANLKNHSIDVNGNCNMGCC